MKHVKLFEAFTKKSSQESVVNEAKGQPTATLLNRAVKLLMNDDSLLNTQNVPLDLVKKYYETVAYETRYVLEACALVAAIDIFLYQADKSGLAISKLEKMTYEERTERRFGTGAGSGNLVQMFEMKMATSKGKEAYVYLGIEYHHGKGDNNAFYTGAVVVSQSKITNYMEETKPAIAAGTAAEEYINTQRGDIVVKAINKAFKQIK